MKLWHDRLGHEYFGGIKNLVQSDNVTGASLADKPSGSSTCDSCMKGKQTRKTLRKNNSRSKERCAVIHTEVCGSMSVRSLWLFVFRVIYLPVQRLPGCGTHRPQQRCAFAVQVIPGLVGKKVQLFREACS